MKHYTLLFSLLLVSGFASTAPADMQINAAVDVVTECDIQVGHPSDPHHVGPGRPSKEVVVQLAIPACREAVANNPENPRFHYQLGRALVYWADANGASVDEGVEHVRHASDMQYTQAMFVMGLMDLRLGMPCDAEVLTKAAADKGLKSARISYVDHVLAGTFAECELSASPAEMNAYLEQAGAQISGWYEAMLLGALKRELAEAES